MVIVAKDGVVQASYLEPLRADRGDEKQPIPALQIVTSGVRTHGQQNTIAICGISWIVHVWSLLVAGD
jgi:hypothetical protein